VFRRRKLEDEGPLRGPGGGRVRRRPLRKERRRRRQGLGDYLFISAIFAVIIFFLERFAFKAPWAVSAFEAVVVLVGGVAVSMFTRRWIDRRDPPQKPKR